jgi:hypothetical protein
LSATIHKIEYSEERRFPRRIILKDLSTTDKIASLDNDLDKLSKATKFVDQGFLTFLIDKHFNTQGNFKTSDILPFFEKFNLITSNQIYLIYKNPWMKEPYKGKNNGKDSCIRTVEHFRQCRAFACWNNKDIKIGCKNFNCEYHPNNNDSDRYNKCDIRKGVIWKKDNPRSIYTYGNNYCKVIKEELLRGRKIPFDLLLNVFYKTDSISIDVINKFKNDFHLTNQEMEFFESPTH